MLDWEHQRVNHWYSDKWYILLSFADSQNKRRWYWNEEAEAERGRGKGEEAKEKSTQTIGVRKIKHRVIAWPAALLERYI